MPFPVLPSDIAATVPQSTDPTCTKLQALFSLASKMSTAWEFMFDDDGNVKGDFLSLFTTIAAPTGAVSMWLTENPPSGWLILNGATVSRETYSGLFAVLGTAYGSGDGSTTFTLPNLQQKFPFGASGSNVAGVTGGRDRVTLGEANMPSHKPVQASGFTGFTVKVSSGGTGGLAAGADHETKTADEAFEDVGSDEPFSIIPPYLSVHFIIKT